MTRHDYHRFKDESAALTPTLEHHAMLEQPTLRDLGASRLSEEERVRTSHSAAKILKGSGPDFSISGAERDPFTHPRRSQGLLATGDIAAKYESNNSPDAVNRDPNRRAGHDYGAWQFNSRAKIPQEYVKWAETNDPSTFAALKDHTKSIHRGARGDFGHAWKDLAAKDPNSFNESQRRFAMEKYLKPLEERFPRIGQSQALQEQAFATAIQSGVGGATRLLQRAGFDRDDKSTSDLIASLTAQRTKSYHRNATRYANEGRDLEELSQRNHMQRIDKSAFGDFV
ncbi:MAG TPA: hypothetical protein V6C76_11150 [Drouetiella sp.]